MFHRLHVALAFFGLYFVLYHDVTKGVLFSLLIWSIYLFNQVTDIHEDRTNGRVTDIRGVYLLSLLCFLLPMLLLRSTYLLVYAVVGLIGFWYSQPVLGIRFKNVFFVKNLTAGIIWSFPLLVPTLVAGTWSWKMFFTIFFLILAIELLWDVRDIKGDKKAGILTFPTVMGRKWSIVLGFAYLILVGLLFPHNLFLYLALCVLAFTYLFAKTFSQYRASLFVVWALLMLGLY